MKRLFAVPAMLMLLCLSLRVEAENQYALRQLPVPAGTTESEARGINDAGDAAGYASSRPDPNCFSYALRWQQNSFTILGDGEAYDINNSGVVVGRGNGHAMQYTDDSDITMHGFTAREGHPEACSALSVSNTGYVAGWATNPNTARECSIGWLLPSTLGSSPANSFGRASDVNDLGEYVGQSYDAYGGGATYWSGTSEAAEKIYYPSFTGGRGGEAYGVNNAGVTVGYIGNHAVLWASPFAAPVDLCPDMPAQGYSLAWRINEHGRVIGYTFDGLYDRAWFWDASGGMHMLPDVGFGCMAYGINNRSADSDIAGAVFDSAGVPHAVVWQVIPEPSSLLALGSGLLALGSLVRRRR